MRDWDYFRTAARPAARECLPLAHPGSAAGPRRQSARGSIEALLFSLALVLLPLFLDEDSDFLGNSDILDVGTLIWLAFALAAPMLLPACYRRKGWAEIAAKGRPAGGS